MHPTIERSATQRSTTQKKPAVKSSTRQNGYRSNSILAKPETYGWLHDPLKAMRRKLGPYTVADMEKYIDEYPIELYNGWLVWQDMGNATERTSMGTLQVMFDLPARKRNFGQALPDGTECRLDDGNDIIPDASLVSWERLENDVIKDGPNKRPILTKAPELIVESRSTSNTRAGDAEKRKKYFAHGALIIWDVSEKDKFIDVYRAESPNDPQRFTIDDVIDCEPILPGWRRRVADIFAKRVSAEAVAGEVVEEWREEGIEKGIEQRNIEIVRNMLQKNLDIELIVSFTDLDETQIKAIQAEWENEQGSV